ncbi:hypothetical protein COCOR_02203 [Corallococcus coralloides DSM 2259]|uniref:Uncharacterized protein n=1 Tax=Corallococcus coralloides (strain ATCC 25202 / DSM 2259 / NBRC 100086 / M2) TaxID=1144275 RepID=H8MKF4_CORCM|nr:hypothetical protein COCOR_02203 [Corallococcus coralloides DSM 2259]
MRFQAPEEPQTQLFVVPGGQNYLSPPAQRGQVQGAVLWRCKDHHGGSGRGLRWGEGLQEALGLRLVGAAGAEQDAVYLLGQPQRLRPGPGYTEREVLRAERAHQLRQQCLRIVHDQKRVGLGFHRVPIK